MGGISYNVWLRDVDRESYTAMRTEPIGDGKNKNVLGQTPMEEKWPTVKKVSFLE
jgi:hypothetical protein